MGALSKYDVVALAMALLFGSGACLMACASLPCGPTSVAAHPESTPPCHGHQQHLPADGPSQPCTHLSTLTAGEALPVVQVFQPDFSALGWPAFLNEIKSFRTEAEPYVQSSSQPCNTSSSVSVLRI